MGKADDRAMQRASSSAAARAAAAGAGNAPRRKRKGHAEIEHPTATLREKIDAGNGEGDFEAIRNAPPPPMLLSPAAVALARGRRQMLSQLALTCASAARALAQLRRTEHHSRRFVYDVELCAVGSAGDGRSSKWRREHREEPVRVGRVEESHLSLAGKYNTRGGAGSDSSASDSDDGGGGKGKGKGKGKGGGGHDSRHKHQHHHDDDDDDDEDDSDDEWGDGGEEDPFGFPEGRGGCYGAGGGGGGGGDFGSASAKKQRQGKVWDPVKAEYVDSGAAGDRREGESQKDFCKRTAAEVAAKAARVAVQAAAVSLAAYRAVEPSLPAGQRWVGKIVDKNRAAVAKVLVRPVLVAYHCSLQAWRNGFSRQSAWRQCGTEAAASWCSSSALPNACSPSTHCW